MRAERRGASISRAVEEILALRPQLLSALSSGFVNYSALARLLRDEVERRLGRRVREDSIKVALIRLRDHVARAVASEPVLEVLAGSTTSLIDDVGLVTLRLGSISELFEPLSGLSARLIQITQGLRTVTIVVDSSALERLLARIERSRVEEVYTGQAAVVVESPRSIISTPGVMAHMTLLLALHGINLTQVISTYTDTLFIVQRERAVEAYSLLRTLIERARGAVKGYSQPPPPL